MTNILDASEIKAMHEAIESGRQEFGRRCQKARKYCEEHPSEERYEEVEVALRVLAGVPEKLREAMASGRAYALVMALDRKDTPTADFVNMRAIVQNLTGAAAIVFGEMVRADLKPTLEGWNLADWSQFGFNIVTHFPSWRVRP